MSTGVNSTSTGSAATVTSGTTAGARGGSGRGSGLGACNPRSLLTMISAGESAAAGFGVAGCGEVAAALAAGAADALAGFIVGASAAGLRSNRLSGDSRLSFADASGTACAALSRCIDHLARLHAVQQRIATAAPDQFLVLAFLDDAALLDGDDAVAVAHGRQAVRDDEHGAALADVAHVALDRLLGFEVEGAGRLIEDQDARVGDQSARDRDALALAARERAAALADHGIVAFRQLQNEVVRAGELGGRDHVVERHAGIRERDVLAHRPIEQHVLL